MTEIELNQIFYIDKEIKRLRKRLQQLDKDEASDERDRLRRQIRGELESRLRAECIVREYIAGVADPEIRAIIELRFIYKRAWQDIAIEISPRHKDYDRTTVRKKLERYLREH